MAQQKILSVDQLRALDVYTMTHEPIASIDLMERASRTVFNWLSSKYASEVTFTLFCGSGNNGGDGLAIARLLHKHGYKTQCFLVDTNGKFSEENLKNQERLAAVSPFQKISEEKDIPTINSTVVIDALFGSGLDRPTEGLTAHIIRHINQSGKEVVSIDIASGLYADKASGNHPIVQPMYTLSFQLPKMAFLLPENEKYTGEWKVLDIGLSETFIERAATSYFYTNSISSFEKSPAKFSHKGSFGHALLIAGSFGKIGAALLASRACLRAGAGLLTTHVPRCGYDIMQVGLPEAMVAIDAHDTCFSHPPLDIHKYSALGIGPGLGTNTASADALEKLLSTQLPSLVIDADAVNIVSQRPHLLSKLPKNTILTPHPGEFKRLVGSWSNDFERLSLLRDFCQKHQLIVVLKGAHTAVCNSDGNVFFNSSGNPGMATAGSGDVLTGMVLAFLAQGYSPIEAARIAVFNHGEAGDLAQKNARKGRFLASEIIAFI